jgi:hypothetical protein
LLLKPVKNCTEFPEESDYLQAGSGDLDECNGMIRSGSYGYYVINAYPWILACYKGTPDPSFNKGRSISATLNPLRRCQ